MLTVVASAPNRNLTTLSRVREALQLDGGDDEFLLDRIAQASATIESWCGRRFARERIVETSPSVLRFGGTVTVSRWPILEIHSVTANGEPIGQGRYVLDHGVLSGVFGHVSIDYTAGYILPGEEGSDLPLDIEQATIDLVRDAWFARRRDPALRSETVDGMGAVTFFDRSPSAGLAALLSPYRVPVAL